MTDIKSSVDRSYNMSRIRGDNTKPELTVRKYLFKNGFRYRLHVRNLPGVPDIVLPKLKTIIFVNGCFWHAHEGCKYFVWPKNNADFWKDKISGNVQRDKRNYESLEAMGWRVIVVWECQIKRKSDRESALLSLFETLLNSQKPLQTI
ncbi:MAG: very short patch repair endonuclease [Anaerolineaceae bacterium]